MLKLAIQQQAQLSASQQAQSESNLKTLESAQTKSQTTLSNLENENQTLHQSIEDLKSELQNQYTQFESILESSDDKSINLELSAKIKSQKNTIARNEREVLTWKHKLMSKDDSINDKVKSAQFLKASLKVAEDELEYLREYLNQNNMTPVDQILASRKVKTIRGGGGKFFFYSQKIFSQEQGRQGQGCPFRGHWRGFQDGAEIGTEVQSRSAKEVNLSRFNSLGLIVQMILAWLRRA